MAYQNVGTPRFYVNVFEWLSTMNTHYIIDSFAIPDDIFRTLPVNVQPRYDYAGQPGINVGFSNTIFTEMES